MNILNYIYGAGGDTYKVRRGEKWIDLVTVVSAISANEPSTLYLGVSDNYWLSWNITKDGVQYSDHSYYAGGTNAATSYTINSQSKPNTLRYGLTSDALLTQYGISANLAVGHRINASPNANLIIPPVCTAANVTACPSVFAWTLSGGIEAMRFKLLPGSYSISALMWGPSSSIVLADSAVYTYEYKEISAAIINENNINNNWYVDVSAIQWTNQPLPSSHEVKYFYDAYEGLESSKFLTTSATYFTYPSLAPSYNITENPIDGVRFNYNTPGTKHISAAVVETLTAVQYISDGTTTLISAASTEVQLFNHITNPDILANYQSYPYFYWSVASTVASSLELSAIIYSDGTIATAPETTSVSGFESWISSALPLQSVSSMQFIFNTSDIDRIIIPHFGYIVNTENIVSVYPLTSMEFSSSAIGIIGYGTNNIQQICAVQLYGNNNQYITVLPYSMNIYWDNPNGLSATVANITASNNSFNLSGFQVATPIADTKYSLSVHDANSPSISATYKWFNYTPSSMSLTSDFNNCPREKTLNVSAVNGSYLLNGSDLSGNNIYIKWVVSSSDNIVLQDINNNVIIPGETVDADIANPITVIITPDDSYNPSNHSFSISADCYMGNDYIVSAFSSTNTVSVSYDNFPLGFDVDANINRELINSLPSEGIYRFLDSNKSSYKITTSNIVLTAISGIVYNTTDIINNGWDSLFTWTFGSNSVTGVNNQEFIMDLANLSTNSHITSTLILEVGPISAHNNFLSSHCITKEIDINIINSSILQPISSRIFPVIAFDSNHNLISLIDTPSAYNALSPYPSAYGEGNTSDFILSGITYGYYDNFIWKIAGNNITYTSSGLYSVSSEEGVEKNIAVSYGAFKNGILENYTLSTYKNDDSGLINIYPNWIEVDPIKIVNYPSPTISLHSYISANATGVNIQPYVSYQYFSPIQVTDVNNITWSITANTDSNLAYNNAINPNYMLFNTSEINNLSGTVDIESVLSIPVSIYSFTSINRTFNIGPTAILYPTINFLLTGQNYYDAINNSNNNTVTGFVSCSLQPQIVLNSEAGSGYSYNWVVGENTYTTQLWTSSFTSIPTVSSIDITLEMVNDNNTLRKDKVLTIGNTPRPTFVIQPEKYTGQIGDTIKIRNLSYGLVPLKNMIWEVEGTTYEDRDLIEHTFTTDGIQRISVTSVDVKNNKYSEIFPIITIYDSWNEYIPDALVSYKRINIELPNDLNDINIGPNDWVTAEVFNNSINKLNENLTYLNNITTYYSTPPQSYLGYWNSDDRWKLKNINSDYTNIQSIGSELRDILIGDQYEYHVYKTRIVITDKSNNTNIIYTVTNPLIGVEFKNIKSAFLDDKEHIIVFDEELQYIYILDFDINDRYNIIKAIRFWGGLGGLEAKYKFQGAKDMYVVDAKYIYVLDALNKCVKQYSIAGVWLNTFSNNLTNFKSSDLQSISVDTDYNVFVLADSNIINFDNNDKLINVINWRNNIDDIYQNISAKRILASVDVGMIYIILDSIVIKMTNSGGFVGAFAQFDDANYQNAKQLDNRMLYIIADGFISKYIDFISFNYTRSIISPKGWQKTDFNIKPDEFVQDWVYNKCFHRFYDSLVLFNESVFNRILLTTDNDGQDIYKIFPRNRDLDTAISYNKSDIYIGMNELVTAEVINRCLGQLYQVQLDILSNVITRQTHWEWINVVTKGTNPVTWADSDNVRWLEAVN